MGLNLARNVCRLRRTPATVRGWSVEGAQSFFFVTASRALRWLACVPVRRWPPSKHSLIVVCAMGHRASMAAAPPAAASPAAAAGAAAIEEQATGQQQRWGWGSNGSGALGCGHTEDLHAPTLAPSLQERVHFGAISCGGCHTLAVDGQSNGEPGRRDTLASPRLTCPPSVALADSHRPSVVLGREHASAARLSEPTACCQCEREQRACILERSQRSTVR
jgi:hypothetical protein